MVLRDAMLFVGDLIHARWSKGHNFYWDNSGPGLRMLVKRLSNPDDLERRAIRKILREEKPSGILDVACGPATELAGYKKGGLGLDYVGLDKSNYMLGIAKGRFDGTPFVRGDAGSLPFKDNSFEAVLLKHILEHVPFYGQALEEAVRVSGKIVVIDFFHRLLPLGFDVNLYDRRGYWNNWYSRPRFEAFLDGLPISGFEKISATGPSSQEAEIYVLRKRPAGQHFS
ncbi:MAG: methyltransferase domain-containing protein [archaeon]